MFLLYLDVRYKFKKGVVNTPKYYWWWLIICAALTNVYHLVAKIHSLYPGKFISLFLSIGGVPWSIWHTLNWHIPDRSGPHIGWHCVSSVHCLFSGIHCPVAWNLKEFSVSQGIHVFVSLGNSLCLLMILVLSVS